MRKNGTELVFVLDKSGSMSGLEADTIGGFNGMLAKQKALEGACRITTVLFDNQYELLHDRIDLEAVRPMSGKEYQVGGSTAFLDAIGRTIGRVDNARKNTAAEFRAGKVIFIIITDGEENSSREFSSVQVKRLIERQKKRFGWEFVFLGANIDAVETARHFGIQENRAVPYISDSEGTQLNFSVMCDAVETFRESGEVDEMCLARIRKDAKRRGG